MQTTDRVTGRQLLAINPLTDKTRQELLAHWQLNS